MATAGQLYRVARLLREVALTATSDANEPAAPLALVAITDDIAQHDATTVSEIAGRTGLAQSLVSRTVVRLRDAGVAETRTDDADRRRTCITISAAARSEVFAPRAERGITDALHERRPELSPQRIAAIEKLIDKLIAELAEHPQRPSHR